MKRFRQRKAFTIVEMVIVIAVIAILATVLVPTISGVIQKANHSADQQFVASLNVQLALWEVDNGDIASKLTSARPLISIMAQRRPRTTTPPWPPSPLLRVTTIGGMPKIPLWSWILMRVCLTPMMTA